MIPPGPAPTLRQNWLEYSLVLPLTLEYGLGMSEHRRVYLTELRSASEAIKKAGAFVTDPDDPEWLGVDPSKLNAEFADYYSGLVSAGYALGFI